MASSGWSREGAAFVLGCDRGDGSKTSDSRSLVAASAVRSVREKSKSPTARTMNRVLLAMYYIQSD